MLAAEIARKGDPLQQLAVALVGGQDALRSRLVAAAWTVEEETRLVVARFAERTGHCASLVDFAPSWLVFRHLGNAAVVSTLAMDVCDFVTVLVLEMSAQLVGTAQLTKSPVF